MTTAHRLPGVAWRKSSYSGANGGNCIEIGEGLLSLMPVRGSNDPEVLPCSSPRTPGPHSSPT